MTSWKKLKKKLISEFKTEINNAVLHAQLAKRRRSPNESARQYIGAMQEIASQECVEEEALIEHIIDGIQDDEINKTVLYGARSLYDMRKQLELYDRRKEKLTEHKKQVNKKEMENKKDKYTKSNKIRCYGCGSLDHSFKNCTTKEKGVKCFNRNNFGHIATACQEQKKPRRKASGVNCVKSVDEKYFTVNINNISCQALLDTGSDVNIIRQDTYKKIGQPKLQQTTRLFTEFRNATTKPSGTFAADIVVGDDRFRTNVFVVPSTFIEAEIILGHELLKDVLVVIQRGLI